MSEPSSEDPSSGGEGSASGGGGGGAGGAPGNKDSKLYEKPSGGKKKLLRLLTVLAYVMSVSMAAIMLSLYYVFLWDPHGTGPRYGHLAADPQPRLNYTQDGSSPQFQPLHQQVEASSNITSNLTSLVSSPPAPHTTMNQTASEQLAT
ncbi:putative transmembrane protein INAFM1 [Schistocerca piceifrons]|uniref:putative transmembrane protein INAFM1 n=1 Tax=Schistocerca piceifrons TaxID=274613 RepID=UPI001F5F1CB7|nr:putative transmembrane protein INAFM1 [Schistocerca piceifrons]